MPRAIGSFKGYGEGTLVSSAARTVNGDTGPLDGFGGLTGLRIQLDVTAAAGTSPTLNVVLEDTLDGTNWNVVGTFAQKVAAGREIVNILPSKVESASFSPLFANRLRVRWTVAGTTPSFTFSLVVAGWAGGAAL